MRVVSGSHGEMELSVYEQASLDGRDGHSNNPHCPLTAEWRGSRMCREDERVPFPPEGAPQPTDEHEDQDPFTHQ